MEEVSFVETTSVYDETEVSLNISLEENGDGQPLEFGGLDGEDPVPGTSGVTKPTKKYTCKQMQSNCDIIQSKNRGTVLRLAYLSETKAVFVSAYIVKSNIRLDFL